MNLVFLHRQMSILEGHMSHFGSKFWTAKKVTLWHLNQPIFAPKIRLP